MSGADVDAPNDENDSVLHIVCRTGRHSKLVRLLIEHASARSLDSHSLIDSATPFRFCIEHLTRKRLRMARALLHAGADPNISFNRPATLLAEYFDIRAALGQDSLFDHLIILPPYRFSVIKKHDESNSSQLDVSSTSNLTQSLIPLTRFFQLIRMIVRAGYRLCPRDVRLFRESWFYKESLSQSARIEFDRNVLAVGVTQPRSLKDICRYELRCLMAKPLRKSIRELDIPVRLKDFLTLDILD